MVDTNLTLFSRKKTNIRNQITISSVASVQKKSRKNVKEPKKIFSLIDLEKKIGHKKKVKLEEIYVFADQFSTLLDAGVPLISSLSILAQQIENKHFRFIIDKIIRDVNGGDTLTRALSKYPDVFSNLFVSMVRAAEKGGNMARVLKQLSNYLQEQYNLEKKIKAAIVYPRFVFFFFLSVLLVIIFGLVPKFKSIFESFNAQLPIPTQVLINLSHFATNHLILEVAVIVTVIFLYSQFKKTTPGRYFLDRIKINLPVIGDLILKSALSKFSRTLSILMQSGVSLVECLNIAGETAQNIYIIQALKEVKQGVVAGSSLHKNLHQNPIFPILLVKMVMVGEQSGALDKMLLKVSEIYDAHVDSKISGLSSIIEPALMAGLGVVALVVIVALYLPIFRISGIVQ